MSSTSQAGFLAQKALGSLWNATVAGASSLTGAINNARKQYSDYYEKEQLDALRKQGKPPAELLFLVLQRFYYLSMAGYNNEAAAAARKIATKLAEFEKSSLPLDLVVAAGRILTDASSRYGDFSTGSWLNLSDFLNSSRMGKDHYDRDALVSDFYFAFLLLAEKSGGLNEQFERALREAAGRLVEGSGFRSEAAAASSYAPYSSPAYNLDALSGSLPSYAQVPSSLPSYSKVPPAAAAAPAASGGAKQEDPKTRAAKTLYVIASSIKKAAEEAEGRRHKTLKDAEEMLRREREAMAGLGGKPATGFGSANFSYSTSTASSSSPSSSIYSSSSFSGLR